MVNVGETGNYVSQIKRRVQENLSEREERDKRRRRVLVEQMKAMHQQEVSVGWRRHHASFGTYMCITCTYMYACMYMYICT